MEKGDLETDHVPGESVWADILTKTLQGRAFGEFGAELMTCPVDYKEESTFEDVEKTTGVPDTNDA